MFDFDSELRKSFRIHNLLYQGIARFKCPLTEKLNPFLNSLWTCSLLVSLGIAQLFYKDRNIHSLTPISLSLGRKAIKSSLISLLRHLLLKLQCPSMETAPYQFSLVSLVGLILPLAAEQGFTLFFSDRLGLTGVSLALMFH